MKTRALALVMCLCIFVALAACGKPDIIGNNLVMQAREDYEKLDSAQVVMTDTETGETVQTFPDGGESSPNLLVYPYTGTTSTINGVTFTDNGDGTITMNGTATARINFSLTPTLANSSWETNGEKYHVALFPKGSQSTFFINGTIGNKTSGTSTPFNSLASLPNFYSTDFVIDTSAHPEYTHFGRLYIAVASGATLNNVTIKPMVCLESEYDGKWYPYWNPTMQIYNPTRFEAKPLLKVTGYGTLGVGDSSVIITGTAGQEIYIDCEIMEAWSLNGSAIIPRNDYVQYVGNKFPVLASGVNGISMSGNITRVEVTPRWWRL